ncbi:MAG: rhomboid family intramembrane serine protease [Planctomycetota bacterium]|nr:rhomboid family intramembrane serine protease [Planctomycetota bacterium]
MSGPATRDNAVGQDRLAWIGYLREDFRDYPATMWLAAVWVAVYLGMIAAQLFSGRPIGMNEILLGTPGVHLFGDLTTVEFMQGQVWRALTCTFVHAGLLHLGLNLFGFYQLGCMVESWYGPRQFLAFYVLTGLGGNLFAIAARSIIGVNPTIQVMGGSVVVMGLVALCAVVGRRSRTRFGEFMRKQMTAIIVSTLLLGLFVPIFDNWGHLGGALVGAAIGLVHRTLITTTRSRWARAAAVLATLAIATSGVCQAWTARREYEYLTARRRLEQRELLIDTLKHFNDMYALATDPNPPVRGLLVPPRIIEALNALDRERWRGADAEVYARLRSLYWKALAEPPTAEDRAAYEAALAALVRSATTDCEALRQRIDALAPPAPPRVGALPKPAQPLPRPAPKGPAAGVGEEV